MTVVNLLKKLEQRGWKCETWFNTGFNAEGVSLTIWRENEYKKFSGNTYEDVLEKAVIATDEEKPEGES